MLIKDNYEWLKRLLNNSSRVFVLLCVGCGQNIFSCRCGNRTCCFEHAIWAVCSHLSNPARRKWFKPVLLVLHIRFINLNLCVTFFTLSISVSLTSFDIDFFPYHGFSSSSCSSCSCWRLCIQLLSPFRAVRTFVVLKTDCLSPSTKKTVQNIPVKNIQRYFQFYNSE